MTSVFKHYAEYYELLYRDKDYRSEVEYALTHLRGRNNGAGTLLDLGCGTGNHALAFAELGYSVVGIDLSETMLELAKIRRDKAEPDVSTRLEFLRGDARSVRLGRVFDSVVSLFHVISYQTTNNDLLKTFATARAHMENGGLFFFDCWYGPAVLTNMPISSTKEVEDDRIRVRRVSNPIMSPNTNCVAVQYDVHVENKVNGKVATLHECHNMRYLFMPEIELMLSLSNLRLERSEAFLSGREPDLDTWGVTFVARAV